MWEIWIVSVPRRAFISFLLKLRNAVLRVVLSFSAP